jgi:hypothetical protein
MFREGTASLGYTHRFNRLGATLSSDLLDLGYEDDRDRDRERTDRGLTGRLFYDFSPGFTGFLQTGSVWRHYAQGSARRDSRTQTSLVGSAFDLGGILFGEVGIGVLTQDFEDRTADDFTGLALRSKITWNVTQTTSLIGVLDRREEATRVTQSSSRIRSYASIEAQQEVRYDVLLKASYAYENNSYEGLDLEQDTQTLNLSARHWLNRYLSLAASYTYLDRTVTRRVSGSLNLSPFQENVFLVSLGAQF